MIERLKKTAFGKKIYRFSRLPVIGWPVHMLARLVQAEMLQVAHFTPRIWPITGGRNIPLTGSKQV